MITQSLDMFINREPQVVFDFLSEPANLPRWNPMFQTAEGAMDASKVSSSRWATRRFRGTSPG